MPFSYLYSRHRPAWLFTCVGLVMLIAFCDYATGYELSLASLYLATIFVATWLLGLPAGLGIAVLSLIVWQATEYFMGHVYGHPLYHIWEVLIRFATWAIFAVLLTKLKIALAHADERFVTVLEGLDAAVYVVDMRNGELLYVNKECRAAFGAGHQLTSLRQIESRFATLPAGTFQSNTLKPADTSGEFHDLATGRWYLIHFRTIRWTDGREVRLHVATDITLHKQTEELSRQQQDKLQLTARLISVGEMASTLAHELNQPLAAIANYNMGCVRRLRSGEYAARDLLETMEKSGAEAERAGKIIQRAREMVRRRDPQRMDCDINHVITDIANMVEIDAEKNGVSLNLQLAPALPHVLGDKVMLEQAILNLTRNAIEAMQNTPSAQRRLTIVSRCDDARTVDIEVRDSGCGIPAELADNLFTPFFTTKREGMGMGLNICRSVAEFHDGHLWASRNADAGSTFHFSLPAAA